MDESCFPVKKTREPKIVIFEEPGRKKRNTAGKRARKVKNDDTEDSSEDFISVAREVKEFGITGFTRKEQKKNQQKYAEYLGAHTAKQQKVPYPMLMNRVKRRKEKEKKEGEMERAMGVFRKKKRAENDKLSTKLNLGRWVDKSTLEKGKMDTHLKVNRKDMAKLKSKSK